MNTRQNNAKVDDSRSRNTDSVERLFGVGREEAADIAQWMAAAVGTHGTPEFAACDAAVQAFYSSGTADDAERVVKTMEQRLLSDAALGLLALLEAKSRSKDERPAPELFAAHRRLLADCRRRGIEAAFRTARRQDVDDYYWTDKRPAERSSPAMHRVFVVEAPDGVLDLLTTVNADWTADPDAIARLVSELHGIRAHINGAEFEAAHRDQSARIIVGTQTWPTPEVEETIAEFSRASNIPVEFRVT